MQSMEKFFSIFGKIMLIVLVLGSLTYGGYYFGRKTVSVKERVAGNDEVVPASAVPTLLPTPHALSTIVAGLPKSAGLSFDQYSVITPSDWVSKKESQTAMDEKLVLSNGEYIINIFQAATGGALCLYNGDAEFEGPSSRFTKFVDLTTKDNRSLRRSGEGNAFTVCQKSGDGSYQQPTNYGHIAIKTAANPTAEMLSEIDQIISSLKKI